MNKICGIYKITCTVTGDFYIGSSKNISKRWNAHRAPCEHKAYPNYKMYQDMDKYGLENFTFEVLEETEDLKVREQFYMDTLKPTYNYRRSYLHDLDKKELWWESNKERIYANKKTEEYRAKSREYMREYRSRKKSLIK